MNSYFNSPLILFSRYIQRPREIQMERLEGALQSVQVGSHVAVRSSRDGSLQLGTSCPWGSLWRRSSEETFFRGICTCSQSTTSRTGRWQPRQGHSVWMGQGQRYQKDKQLAESSTSIFKYSHVLNFKLGLTVIKCDFDCLESLRRKFKGHWGSESPPLGCWPREYCYCEAFTSRRS